MPRYYYWLSEHVRAILIVLGIIVFSLSFTLSAGRIKRYRDHSAYIASAASLILKKPIATTQQGLAGTSDLKQQLAQQNKIQTALIKLPTNPYTEDQTLRAAQVNRNEKILKTSRTIFKRQTKQADAQQKILDAEEKHQQSLIQERQRKITTAKKYLLSLVDPEAVTVKTEYTRNLPALKRGAAAYESLPRSEQTGVYWKAGVTVKVALAGLENSQE
jgi:hypothetical protein